jgi:hypothetical protein
MDLLMRARARAPTRTRSSTSTSTIFALFLLVACKPELDQRATVIATTRVLAVQQAPAEVDPRDEMAFTALVVGADGAFVASPAATWALCTARKPLAELGPVSPACYGGGPDGTFVGLGAGASVKATMPSTACRDFGPEVPQSKPGEPYGRPVDPDPTGGYYQPVSVFLDGVGAAVDQARVGCGVAGASSEDVVTFRQRYHANANPRVAAVRVDGAPADDPTMPVHVALGGRVTVTVEWPGCPLADVCGDGTCGPDETLASCVQDCGGPAPKGCEGAERYLWFDPGARVLVARREQMRVSWFSAGGLFDVDRTGRDETDDATTSDDAWTAPTAPALVHAWIVVRDDRGGVGWRALSFDVR